MRGFSRFKISDTVPFAFICRPRLLQYHRWTNTTRSMQIWFTRQTTSTQSQLRSVCHTPTVESCFQPPPPLMACACTQTCLSTQTPTRPTFRTCDYWVVEVRGNVPKLMRPQSESVVCVRVWWARFEGTIWLRSVLVWPVCSQSLWEMLSGRSVC
jgi:hypothetical protein